MRSMIQMGRLERIANLVHPSAIDTQIGITDAGCRANLNHSGIGVDEKFEVVNKAEEAATALKMKIIFILSHELCAGHLAHYTD